MRRLLTTALLSLVSAGTAHGMVSGTDLPMAQARSLLKAGARNFMSSLTETPAVIRLRRCERLGPNRVRCHVEARGDRAHLRWVSTVYNNSADSVLIFNKKLRVVRG